MGGLPAPGVFSLRKLGFFSGQSVFLHGLDPGSNPGEAQIKEIVKVLAKTGRPRGSSPRSSGHQPGASANCAALGYLYPGGWCATFK